MEKTCTVCGGEVTQGSLGTIRDPQTYWSGAEVKSFGRIRVSQSSGERIAVVAERCSDCGRIELVAMP